MAGRGSRDYAQPDGPAGTRGSQNRNLDPRAGLASCNTASSPTVYCCAASATECPAHHPPTAPAIPPMSVPIGPPTEPIAAPTTTPDMPPAASPISSPATRDGSFGTGLCLSGLSCLLVILPPMGMTSDHDDGRRYPYMWARWVPYDACSS